MVRRTNLRKNNRKGTAVVELGVCLPVLVLLVIASIELSNFIFLKQSLASAAYEGAREAVRHDATGSSVNSRAVEILNSRNLAGVTVTTTPAPDVASRGDSIQVTVSAPSSANRVVMPKFIEGLSVASTVTMVKE